MSGLPWEGKANPACLISQARGPEQAIPTVCQSTPLSSYCVWEESLIRFRAYSKTDHWDRQSSSFRGFFFKIQDNKLIKKEISFGVQMTTTRLFSSLFLIPASLEILLGRPFIHQGSDSYKRAKCSQCRLECLSQVLNLMTSQESEATSRQK